jgi:hypothetical protein
MSELELLDRGYATVMDQIVATGRAPHFTDLARQLDIDLPAAKELVHELVAMTPGWVHPGTDHIASFPPFNIQPTQHRRGAPLVRAVRIRGPGGAVARAG